MTAEEYIEHALQNYQVVGLGEGGHCLENFHQFLTKIIKNQKLMNLIDIIIIEFANANYQDTLDRFISGEKINTEELPKIWRESTQSPFLLGESSIYLEFLQTIREYNIHQDMNKKIRVVAGDPPITWNTINNQEDYQKQISYGATRHRFPTELIEKFALKEQKRSLVIFSEFHLTKISDSDLEHYETITNRVNQIQPNLMKSIGVIYSQKLLSEIRGLDIKPYALIKLLDSKFGALPASIFWNTDDVLENNQSKKLFGEHKLKDIFDALLYVGPIDELKRSIPNTKQFNTFELQEFHRRRRMFA